MDDIGELNVAFVGGCRRYQLAKNGCAQKPAHLSFKL
jgi:hypothetical protein